MSTQKRNPPSRNQPKRNWADVAEGERVLATVELGVAYACHTRGYTIKQAEQLVKIGGWLARTFEIKIHTNVDGVITGLAKLRATGDDSGTGQSCVIRDGKILIDGPSFFAGWELPISSPSRGF